MPNKRFISSKPKSSITDVPKLGVSKATDKTYTKMDSRQVFYLSMEFLMGRTLSNAMLNLGVVDG